MYAPSEVLGVPTAHVSVEIQAVSTTPYAKTPLEGGGWELRERRASKLLGVRSRPLATHGTRLEHEKTAGETSQPRETRCRKLGARGCVVVEGVGGSGCRDRGSDGEMWGYTIDVSKCRERAIGGR